MKHKTPTPPKTPRAAATTAPGNFPEIISMIRDSRRKALQSANTELIDLYWRVGEYFSRNKKVSPLGTQLLWVHNLQIFSRCRLPEEPAVLENIPNIYHFNPALI